MFNAHRGMVSAPNSRLTELLDQVRQEFDNQQNRTGDYEQQSRFADTRLLLATSMHFAVSLCLLNLHFLRWLLFFLLVDEHNC